MPNYRRVWCPGGTYFFTHTLAHRHDNDLLVRHVDLLRQAVRKVRGVHPFHIHAWVVLPDHLHCVIELPRGDARYALRWRLIKMIFSRSLTREGRPTRVQERRGEKGIWQRRYWEHLIRDERDFRQHVDYVHINPFKHGLVQRVGEWPYSTFHRLVEQGIYPADWAGEPDAEALPYDD
ncbi:MAG: transposase [Pseudomonas sp.]|uniref:REP-associated tyrosine transposase n=1 Tax=Pseudomonas sp. TaxID=306 RepID=UPI00299F28BD|nr:transposase [Pseudomonas sp.]MDX1724047.1 transposase [Pseudomonas sp.]